MATITGDPTQYPISFYEPSDASPPKASEVNPALEALGDRTAYLKQFTGQLHALNFPIHPAQSSIGEMHSAIYDPKYRKWHVVGNTENVRTSQDNGLSWSSVSEIATVGSNENCSAIDIDPSGNAVVTTEAAFIFEKTGSTDTWTKQAVSFLSPSSMLVAYDPVRTKWVVFALSTGSAAVITSTNRTSWSSATAPSSFATVNLHDMAVNKSTGRIVLVAQNAGVVKVRTTDNAATSWTSRADISLGITPDNLAIVRDPTVANRWVLIANRTTGAWNTEVWESTDDGATFSRICQNVFHALYRCAFLGGLAVGITMNPAINRFEVVFSLDKGATWRPSMMCIAGTPRGVYAGEGGFAVVTSSDIYLGTRIGLPSVGVFT